MSKAAEAIGSPTISNTLEVLWRFHRDHSFAQQAKDRTLIEDATASHYLVIFDSRRYIAMCPGRYRGLI